MRWSKALFERSRPCLFSRVLEDYFSSFQFRFRACLTE